MRPYRACGVALDSYLNLVDIAFRGIDARKWRSHSVRLYVPKFSGMKECRECKSSQLKDLKTMSRPRNRQWSTKSLVTLSTEWLINVQTKQIILGTTTWLMRFDTYCQNDWSMLRLAKKFQVQRLGWWGSTLIEHISTYVIMSSMTKASSLTKILKVINDILSRIQESSFLCEKVK